MADSPLPTMIFKKKSHYNHSLKFLPKVSYEFHINRTIHVPFFPLKPCQTREEIFHTLNVRRTLVFYLDRTKPFRKSPRMLVSIVDRS